MKNLKNIFFLVLLFLVVAISSILADEPPSFSDFKVESENGEYFAQVKCATEKCLSYGLGNYSLSVYKKSDSSAAIWSAPYYYDGYTEGHLSGDGKTFIYVSFWYYPAEPVVTIYQSDKPVKNLNGKEFKINDSQIQKSVSHELWLYDQPWRFVNNDLFEIMTIDKKVHAIDVNTGKIVQQE